MLELWQHQKDAVKFAEDKDEVALFMEVGTGKTPTAINIIRQKFNVRKRFLKTLILGPRVILDQFRDEFKLFSKVPMNRIKVIHGTGKKRVSNLKAATTGEANIILLNYEALLNRDIFDQLVKWAPEMLICDEVHYLKNYKSKRSKAVAQLALLTNYRVIMTGTPILRNIEDLFMQYKVLDCGKTFGSNYFVFRSTYMMDENAAWAHQPNHFPKMVPRPEMYDDLNQKIYAKAVRALKNDCLDLPEFVKYDIKLDMNPTQKRMYEEMERDFVTFIESKKEEPDLVVAELALTKSMKLLQIASGFVIDEEGTTHEIGKSNPKLDALENILSQVCEHNKVIIWACFKSNHKIIGKLCDKMKIGYVFLNGDLSQKQKQASIDSFRNDHETRVIIANQKAGGTGLNLKEAAYSVYFSKGYGLSDDVQSEARNYRGGSIDFHTKVTRIDLVTRGTLDEDVTTALYNKIEMSKSVIDRVKERLNER